MNPRDIAFKAFWTGLAAVLGVALTYLADAPYAWAPVAVVVINAVSAYVRQRVGEVPPKLEDVAEGDPFPPAPVE